MKKTIYLAGVLLLLAVGMGCKPQATTAQPVSTQPAAAKPGANMPATGKPVQADVSMIAPGTGSSGEEQEAEVIDPSIEGLGADAKAGKRELLGMMKLEGELYSSKYGQAMVAGVALPTAYYCIPGTPDWKPEILEMKGKSVVLEGEVWRYFCNPTEQCDVSGHMDSIHQLKYLKALE